MQGLKAAPVIVDSLKITAGTLTGLKIDLMTQVTNPSDIRTSVGTVVFDMVYQNQKLGKVIMENLTLNPGLNKITAKATLFPQTLPAIAAGFEFVSRYVMGKETAAAIEGNMESTDIASVKDAFSQIKLTSVVPGLGQKLIKSTTLFLLSDGEGSVLMDKAQTTVDIYNPLDVVFSILEVNSTVTYNGQQLGSITSGPLKEPITVGPKSTITTPKMEVSVTDPNVAGTILGALDPNNPVFYPDVWLRAKQKVGDYETFIEYRQEKVENRVSLPDVESPAATPASAPPSSSDPAPSASNSKEINTQSIPSATNVTVTKIVDKKSTDDVLPDNTESINVNSNSRNSTIISNNVNGNINGNSTVISVTA